ncbi:mevalonate kinase family protein [Pseudostreptobacillus hongkongensis]|uniref:mevalonate kinase family protein n=1 Tax=Pseudostreptobacillus hongkongensis TaxID=1162717 RepID=UPI00082DF5D3|nr:hypothetical protein [Pseudostreptobacillus hongkongensis]
MLVKAGSKLYLSGEYAILSDNSYAIISYIPKYTYLEILENNNVLEIETDIEDKDGYILKCIRYMEEYLNMNLNFKYRYYTELYRNGVKYGLGSSASVLVVTIKGIFEILNKSYSKKELFDIAVDISIRENIKGSFGDLACICYENHILFKSSTREKRDYDIQIIDNKVNLDIKAIWTKETSSTSKMISNLNINDKNYIIFSQVSNEIVKNMYNNILNNNINELLKNIEKLNKNLHFLEEKCNINIHSKRIEELLEKYEYSKISGAGGGDYILSFEKSPESNEIFIKLEEE